MDTDFLYRLTDEEITAHVAKLAARHRLEFVDTEVGSNRKECLAARPAEGPWVNEPDIREFLFGNVANVAMRNNFGAFCGYLGVLPGHPWHGKAEEESYGLIDPHGGCTYAANDLAEKNLRLFPSHGVGHGHWWFGFDCAHSMDVAPNLPHFIGAREARYRTIDFVTAELIRMSIDAYFEWKTLYDMRLMQSAGRA